MTERKLTPKMLAYCTGVANGYSYADAYRGAYAAENMKIGTISGECWKLNRDPLITRTIQELSAAAAAKQAITREWLMAWHYKRMTYDAGELSRMVTGCCRHCYGDGHAYQWRAPDYMEAIAKAEANQLPFPDIAGGFGFDARVAPNPDCPKCDGEGMTVPWFADTGELTEAARAAFEGVKETKNGIEVRMADKFAASAELAKLAGFHVDKIKFVGEVPDDDQLAAMSTAEAARYYAQLVAGTLH